MRYCRPLSGLVITCAEASRWRGSGRNSRTGRVRVGAADIRLSRAGRAAFEALATAHTVAERRDGRGPSVSRGAARAPGRCERPATPGRRRRPGTRRAAPRRSRRTRAGRAPRRRRAGSRRRARRRRRSRRRRRCPKPTSATVSRSTRRTTRPRSAPERHPDPDLARAARDHELEHAVAGRPPPGVSRATRSSVDRKNSIRSVLRRRSRWSRSVRMPVDHEVRVDALRFARQQRHHLAGIAIRPRVDVDARRRCACERRRATTKVWRGIVAAHVLVVGVREARR